MEQETIGKRIRLIIEKKDLTRNEFAEKLGWTIGYLNKVINSTVGLTPVVQVMQTFPDIDPRWLILGEGYMFGTIEQGLIRQFALRLESKKYIPVMNAEELEQYLDCINSSHFDYFLKQHETKWEEMLSLKDNNREMYRRILIENGLCKEENQ